MAELENVIEANLRWAKREIEAQAFERLFGRPEWTFTRPAPELKKAFLRALAKKTG